MPALGAALGAEPARALAPSQNAGSRLSSAQVFPGPLQTKVESVKASPDGSYSLAAANGGYAVLGAGSVTGWANLACGWVPPPLPSPLMYFYAPLLCRCCLAPFDHCEGGKLARLQPTGAWSAGPPTPPPAPGTTAPHAGSAWASSAALLLSLTPPTPPSSSRFWCVGSVSYITVLLPGRLPAWHLALFPGVCPPTYCNPLRQPASPQHLNPAP